MIGQSGINTDVFKAHSTRSAATSKMSSVGISLIEIKGRDKRCSSSTFKKNYHEEISNKEMFQNIFNGRLQY